MICSSSSVVSGFGGSGARRLLMIIFWKNFELASQLAKGDPRCRRWRAHGCSFPVCESVDALLSHHSWLTGFSAGEQLQLVRQVRSLWFSIDCSTDRKCLCKLIRNILHVH